MHPQVREFVGWACGNQHFGQVVEFGSRDVNGSVRDLVNSGTYVGVDLVAGPGVDVVCDGRAYETTECVDLVLCLEVLEHDSDPPSLLGACGRVLRAGGLLVMTCAGDGRVPHSAVDGGPLRDGEWYRNVTELELREAVVGWGAVLVVEHDVLAGDLRAIVRKHGDA